MNPSTTYSLQLRTVGARYPSAADDALCDCSMTVLPGEHVALLGMNGSGKTTLLLAVVGLVETTGEIWVDGILLTPASMPEVRSRVGMLFSSPEDQILFPRVLDDVAYTLLRRGIPSGEAFSQAQQALNLLAAGHLADREPYELSHGQRLRVALAGVLVGRPSLLLLDEASAALDPPGKRALAHLLRDTPSAFLLATHDLDLAERCCDRFLLLEDGRIVTGTPILEEIRPRLEGGPDHFGDTALRSPVKT